ncbi:aminotransferase class I/II-fold pyridoxal phosphate-dependent enzyme [Candidatus Kaiserbacteria bacterium]|nr:aminotransferase class I/II-fold pyridoxal phosphate-dependent enzyme [Candidatus Kaiserbacteria bacterium]
MRVSYAQAVYGKEEIAAINRVLQNPSKIVPGKAAEEFEKRIAHLFGKPYGTLVNSGSSANLLALESLKLLPGSEVVTPVFTFGTTVAPIVQKDLVPVFVDVEEGTYLANIDQIEKAISPKTRAIMVPQLLGNILDMARLKRIARTHKLVLIEDSCDTVGATFAGKPTGAYADISTTSFYASHIITAGGAGGMVTFHDAARARIARVMAAWGRESTLFGSNEKSEDIKKRFAGKLAGETYDAKFLFTEIGYNMQSTELNAAFGLEQLKKLKRFSASRRKRFVELMRFFSAYERFFILPRQHPKVRTNWLAFPLTLRPGTPFTRLDITKYLEEKNIQTRPIFSGTILYQPAYRKIKHRKVVSSFPVSDYIMRNGFLIGAHHGMTDEQTKYLLATLRTFLAPFLK